VAEEIKKITELTKDQIQDNDGNQKDDLVT
jgi:hypothetical protein